MTINANGGDVVSIEELTPEQKLQVIKMIEEKTDRSENRVLAAIADLKSEISAVNRKIDGIRSELKSEISAVNRKVDGLAAGITDVDVSVSNRMNVHTLIVAALTVAVVFSVRSQ